MLERITSDYTAALTKPWPGSEEVPRQGGSGKASRGYELGLNSE